jgi:hypothetical protein
MAVSIKELQITPTENVNAVSCEKMFSELQLVRKSIAAAVFALGTDEQMKRFNEYMQSSTPA